MQISVSEPRKFLRVNRRNFRETRRNFRETRRNFRETRRNFRRNFHRNFRGNFRELVGILGYCQKAYMAKICMSLTEGQRKTGSAVCKSLLRKKYILPKVRFSNESWFCSDGIAHKKNQYFWAFNKDAVEPIESQLTLLKVMVWAAVSSKGLIGPYFFPQKWVSHLR